MKNIASRLDIIVLLGACICFVVMVATSGEPTLPFLRGTAVEPILLQLGYPNTVLFTLSSGLLISSFFWWLVVYLPERQRKAILRGKLSRDYEQFQQNVLFTLLWASGQSSVSSDQVRELTDPKKFVEYFGANRQAHWHDALNGLEDDKMLQLDAYLQQFAYSIESTLNNTQILVEDVHVILSHLNEVLRGRLLPPDNYERVKLTGRLLWSIFARFDSFEGYYQKDIIGDAIASI
jgi:hypothetical protein